MARVLVPFDDSEPAREALEYTFELFPDGDYVVLTVADTSGLPYIPNAATDDETDEQVEEMLMEATDQLAAAEELATNHEVTLETYTRIGSPAKEIIDVADENDVDHIVMGSRGRSGVKRILLGSVAEVVVRHSSVPVTVVR